MNNKLYQRSGKQAERTFVITTGIALASAAFVYFVSGNEPITGLILALAAWHIVRRVVQGPPAGVAVLELADGFLIFRNPASKPPRVDRIALEKLHSIRLMGEAHLRNFDCTLMDGKVAHIGPFERYQGEMAVAEWFYVNLPETPFIVDTSATVFEELKRPPGL